MNHGRTGQQLTSYLSQYQSSSRSNQIIYQDGKGSDLPHSLQQLNGLLLCEVVQEETAINDIEFGIARLKDVSLLKVDLDVGSFLHRHAILLIRPTGCSAVDSSLTDIPTGNLAFYLTGKSPSDVESNITTATAYVQDV